MKKTGINIPVEICEDMGLDCWTFLRFDSEEKRQKWIGIVNAKIESVSNSICCPISRVIELQKFKEELFAYKIDEYFVDIGIDSWYIGFVLNE